MTRERWFLIGGGVVGAVVVAAVVAVIVANSDGDDPTVTAEPSVSADSTASVNPAITAPPAPTPSPAPSGYLPVDSLGAAEIPWDEVGPGWFLVEWVERAAVYGDGGVPVSRADFTVSLLAPDGTWYTGPALASTGADRTTFWWGDSVAVFKATSVDGGSEYVGDTSVVSLRDGSTTQVIVGAHSPGWFAVAADGSLIGARYWDDGFSAEFSRYDSDFTATPLCPGTDESQSSLSPDGVRLVCLGYDPAGTGKTSVSLSQLGDGGGSTVIDTFRLRPASYLIDGWFDADTFLLKRWSQGEGSGDTFFTYNIATRTIAELGLPFRAASEDAWVEFNLDSRTYASGTYGNAENDRVDFFTESGVPIASVHCSGPRTLASFEFSGLKALVTCESFTMDWEVEGVAASIVDVATGAVAEAASVRVDAPPAPGVNVIAVYGYPAKPS